MRFKQLRSLVGSQSGRQDDAEGLEPRSTEKHIVSQAIESSTGRKGVAMTHAILRAMAVTADDGGG